MTSADHANTGLLAKMKAVGEFAETGGTLVLYSDIRALVAQAEAAEAQAEKLYDAMKDERGRAQAAEAEVARLCDGLRQLLDCKGSYNGTVSERGGDPAVCPKCEAVARALLDEDGAVQPRPRSEYGGYMGGEPWGAAPLEYEGDLPTMDGAA